MNSVWRIIDLNSGEQISGVWRLSDNKKFYIGDTTPHGPIVGFMVNQGSMLVKCGRASLYGISELSHITLVSLHHLS
jgi:hypothetical protein